MRLCGCVVLYNPDESVISNIESYIDELNVLYVVDNSENKNDKVIRLLKENSKCRYLDMKGNRGIACALNRAWKRAHKNGYEWLLTMDQDSLITAETIKMMKKYIEEDSNDDEAMVCARYLDVFENPFVSRQKVSYVRATITSGSIMNVSVAEEIGGFQNNLFIDEVDHEYCYKLIINGYKIARLNQLTFDHCLGNQEIVNGCRTFNYSPIRNYYYIRNLCYVMKKYKGYKVLQDEWEGARAFAIKRVKAVMYERQKIKKYMYMLLGYIHYRSNKLGKL